MIRNYEPGDIHAALEIYIGCFQNPPFNYDWLNRDSIRRYFADMERTPGFRGFVFEQHGIVAGLCLGHVLDYFAAPTFDIKELLISSSMQGKGVGKELLAAAENALLADGIKLMSLATATYLPAYEFYKKNGYQASDDTVWMGKLLNK